MWDNTQKLVQARDQSQKSGNKMLLWANAYAAQSRVPFVGTDAPNKLDILSIPLTSYLPAIDDYTMLQERMATIVMRILVHHLPCLRSMASYVQWHIPHAYEEEMASNSVVVSASASTLY